MGRILLQYYQYMDQEFGLRGKIELSKRTKIPSITAAALSDSEQNIARIRAAVEVITGKPAPTFK